MDLLLYRSIVLQGCGEKVKQQVCDDDVGFYEYSKTLLNYIAGCTRVRTPMSSSVHTAEVDLELKSSQKKISF